MPDITQPPWSQIIPLIPVGDHAITVAAANWQAAMTNQGLQHQYQAIFGGHQAIRITRNRLMNHAYPNLEQKCLEVFMWGYPSGGRGGLRNTFLANVQKIAIAAPQNQPWIQYFDMIHGLGNIGISTITKLAYFFGLQFQGLMSLILDSRIIDVINRGRWPGLTIPNISYNNAPVNYPAYLDLVANFAHQVGCSPDQIEYTLFSCGEAF